MHTRNFVLAVGMMALGFGAPAALAAYPERPITLVVAYDKGGSTDVTARLLGPYIEKYLGEGAKLEYVNKPGAGGEIGFATIADAAPDGYTIGFINSPNVVTIPIERQARFTLDRLDPLVNVVDDPSVWTVNAENAIKNVADLVAQAKANPNTITIGSTGVGSDDHLSILQVQRQAKVAFTHVPFPGSAANHKAMVAKRIVVSGQNLGEALRNQATDPIRILGVMSPGRWPVAKDLPTFREQGVDVTMASLRGLAAPKGLPADVRAKLVDAMTKAANDPEFVALAAKPETFQPLRIIAPDAFAAELKEMEASFRVIWKDEPWLVK